MCVFMSIIQYFHQCWCLDTQKSPVSSHLWMTTAIQSLKTPTSLLALSPKATTYQVPTSLRSLFNTETNMWIFYTKSDYPRCPSVRLLTLYKYLRVRQCIIISLKFLCGEKIRSCRPLVVQAAGVVDFGNQVRVPIRVTCSFVLKLSTDKPLFLYLYPTHWKSFNWDSTYSSQPRLNTDRMLIRVFVFF